MKKTETVRASEPHACIALSVSVRHSGVYPRCSDWCFDRKTLGSTMAVDKAAVWPASVLTALSAFKEQQFLFLFPFCGEVDHFCSVLHLVSSSPQISFDSCGSECSDYSSSTRPWPRANVLLSTVPVKLWETGRSSWAAALNIYILRGSRGVQAKTRLIKHFHIEKYMIVYLKKSYYCPFYGPE